MQATRDVREGRQPEPQADLIATLLEVAADDTLEPAFRAQVLALPSEADIAREFGSNNDPDAIHAARQGILGDIAKAGQATFETLFTSLVNEGAFTPDAASAGRRALRNAALSYLSYLDGGATRAAEAFASANNMTDTIQALTVLAHRFPGQSETANALGAFLKRFQDNALVLDKWFAIQATIPGASHAGTRESPDGRSAFRGQQPEPRSLADRLVCIFQPDRLQPRGRRRLSLPGAADPCDRPEEPSACRTPVDVHAFLALSGTGACRACQAALSEIDKAPGLSTDVRDIVERILKG